MQEVRRGRRRCWKPRDTVYPVGDMPLCAGVGRGAVGAVLDELASTMATASAGALEGDRWDFPVRDAAGSCDARWWR